MLVRSTGLPSYITGSGGKAQIFQANIPNFQPWFKRRPKMDEPLPRKKTRVLCDFSLLSLFFSFKLVHWVSGLPSGPRGSVIIDLS